MKCLSKSPGCRIRYMVTMLCLMLCLSTVLPSTAFAVEITSPANIFEDYVTVGEDGEVEIDDGEENTNLGGIILTYRSIASTIAGILGITMLIFCMVQFAKLGAAGDNEVARKRAIMGIFTTGIATALFGGAAIAIGFFWNVLKVASK